MTALEKLDMWRVKKKAQGKAKEAQLIADCMEVIRECQGKPEVQIKTEWRKKPSPAPAHPWDGLAR